MLIIQLTFNKNNNFIKLRPIYCLDFPTNVRLQVLDDSCPMKVYSFTMARRDLLTYGTPWSKSNMSTMKHWKLFSINNSWYGICDRYNSQSLNGRCTKRGKTNRISRQSNIFHCRNFSLFTRFLSSPTDQVFKLNLKRW